MKLARRVQFAVVGLVRNGFVQRLLAAAGLLATITGIVGFFTPDAAKRLTPLLTGPVVSAAASLILVGIAAASWPGRRLTRSAPLQGGWVVEIDRGDLFEADDVVITTDRRFNIDRDVIGDTCLVSGLIESWFLGTAADLISATGGAIPSTTDVAAGTVVQFRSGTRRGLLLAVAATHPDGSNTEWADLVASYDRLWREIRSRNLTAVSVPVIGSGFARAQLSFDAVLTQLVLSFHAASLRAPVVRTLRIVISDEHSSFDIPRGVKDLLESLGYK